jgi:hypothetical protein
MLLVASDVGFCCYSFYVGWFLGDWLWGIGYGQLAMGNWLWGIGYGQLAFPMHPLVILCLSFGEVPMKFL